MKIGDKIQYVQTTRHGNMKTITEGSGVIQELRTVKQALVKGDGRRQMFWVDVDLISEIKPKTRKP